MRASAVQLNSNEDKGAQPRDRGAPGPARRGRGRRAGRAAREVQRARLTRQPARGRRAARRPDAPLGRRAAPRARRVAGRRQHRRASRGRREAAQHLGAGRPRRRDPRRLPQDPHVRRRGRRHRPTASPTPRRRATRSWSPTPTALELGLAVCYDLRFPELFRIMAVRGARAFSLPSAFTVPTGRAHWEILVRARAIENQAFVIAAGQVGQPSARPRELRALDDRRPVGHGARAGAGRAECCRRRRPRPRRAGARSARSCPRSRTGSPRAYGGRTWRRQHDEHPPRRERRRQAAHDPRRRDPRVRARGLPPLPRLGHRERGGRRLRARLPLLPLEGRGARHALHRALERCCSRRSPTSTRSDAPDPREAARDRVLHHRLLPATTPT